MKVIMKTIYAGPLGTCMAGGELDVTAKEAADLVHGRFAVYSVKEKPAKPTEPDPDVIVEPAGVSEAAPEPPRRSTEATPEPEPAPRRRGRPPGRRGGLEA
jgi:hypothetical protein